MDFNTLLQTVIGMIVVPLATEIVKKLGSWNIPALSYSMVCVFSVGAAYLLSLIFHPEIEIAEIIRQAIYIALASVAVKSTAKTFEKLI